MGAICATSSDIIFRSATQKQRQLRIATTVQDLQGIILVPYGEASIGC